MNEIKLHRDDHGYADAIDRDGEVLLHLRAGTKVNESNACDFVGEHNALIARLDRADALADLVREVRVYGSSGTRQGACANVPEDWNARAAAALRAYEEGRDEA